MSPQTQQDQGEVPYKPVDVIDYSLRLAGVGSIIGFSAAALKNSFDTKNATFSTVFTRHGRNIPHMAFTAAGLGFGSAAMANLRGKNDFVSAATGAGLAGGIFGLPSKRLPIVVGYAALYAGFAGIFVFTGGRIGGFRNFDENAEFDRKEQLRANRRRPIEETLSEIGEGRGIRPPGYEERRRERLKEKYGFNINPVKATVD
ncbi:hypothetical protein Cpir12675_004391 [Ceratocystis pirilliformis]|uniref:NADH-ubiquinone oxidoreductase 21.3 kDa subunit n=1 Tax=Ceratocystis pirilliformis TaxID=259994 RepID=A0ABR3YWQ5_9PEZI